MRSRIEKAVLISLFSCAVAALAGDAVAASTGMAVWRRSGTASPRYALFDGTNFSSDAGAQSSNNPTWLSIAEAPTRDEIVLVSVGEGANEMRGQVWNGTNWGNSLNLGHLVGVDLKSVAVAYEQQSGRAIVVYDNDSGGTSPIGYRIWDGSSWSDNTDVATPRSGRGRHIYMAAKPNSDEIVMVVGNEAGDSYAMVWDGSSWGNGQTLELFSGQTDFNVVYEQQSGEAMVVYGNFAIEGSYRKWDGFAWTAEDTIPAPPSETLGPRWFVPAADPASDRIALAVLTWGDGSNSHIWLNVWNGLSWGNAQIATVTQNTNMDYPSVGIGFERWSRRALAVYMPNTTTDTYDYRTWLPGNNWTAPMTGPDINANVHALQLVSDPYTNAFMLMSVDDGSDINSVVWNGSSWEPRTELNNNAVINTYKPFAFTFDRPVTFDISGHVFDDVNYGGGPGRDYSASALAAPGFNIGVGGAVVELYDAGGSFVGSVETSLVGNYTFANIDPGTYTVRVVNGSVTSARSGSDGSELAVQTWRSDGTAEAPGTGANRVGGERAASIDPPANNGSQTLASLQAPVGVFTQSIVAVDASASDIADVDFAFNFDTIVNTNNGGQGSLRQFLLNANVLGDDAALGQAGMTAGRETSVFMIPGLGDPLGRSADTNFDLNGDGAFWIRPLTALPVVTSTVSIDGYTQLGAQPNSVAFPGASDAVLVIEINGDLSGGANGLTLAASGCEVTGLVINGGFNRALVVTGSSNLIAGNHIGTNPAATQPSVTRANVGIYVNGANGTTVGGTSPASRNVISGNAVAGIDLTSGAAATAIRGNFIGTDVAGLAGVGNGDGVLLTSATGTSIGGPGPGEYNVIANNDSSGIVALAGTGNVFAHNSIHSNGGRGIDLGDDGVTPNDAGDGDAGLQNFPVLTYTNQLGGNLTVSGTLNTTPNTACTIDLFSGTSADPSGYGEGATYITSIGVNTNGAGDTTFTVVLPPTVPVGDFITATATGPVDGTSEFSLARAVTNLSNVVLIDSADTATPAEISVLDASAAFTIALNNLTSVGVTLSTASSIEFTDGSHTYTAVLANPTWVPPNAKGFPVAFVSAPVPAGISAPGTYDFTLNLQGTDDLAGVYAAAVSTAGRNSLFIRDVSMMVQAVPLQVETVHPGDVGRALLALDFVNGYTTDRALDTLVVTNTTTGPGTPAQLDAEAASLYVYDDVDSSRTLTPADTVIAQSAFASGRATFAISGNFAVPSGGRRALIVSAGIDSTSARDGDRLNASVPFPADVVFSAGALVSPDFSPLYPLDSYGELLVDGMMAHQVFMLAAPADTVYAGDTNVVVAAIRIPQNAYEPDVMQQLALQNYTPDFNPSDLTAMRLWRDNGDAFFNTTSDTAVGQFVFSGDRFLLSGISQSVSAGQVFFVTVDVSGLAPNGNHFRPGIPVDGIRVTTANDGPLDTDTILSKAYYVRNIEFVAVASIPLLPGPVYPGDSNVPLLAFNVRNNTLAPIALDTLRITHTSTGSGTQNDLDNTLSSLRLFVDNGNHIVDAGDSLVTGGIMFAGGSLVLRNLNLSLSVGAAKQFVLAGDIDSTCSADGTVLQVEITSSSHLGFSAPATVAGVFPLASAARTIDGMKRFQIAHYPRPNGTIVTGTTDLLLLDFGLPANGYSLDTLRTINIYNQGTATSEHFSRLTLYVDGGDNTFDFGFGDDTNLGDFAEDLAIPGGKAFRIQNLNLPMTAVCGDHVRMYVSADIASSYTVGGTVRMSIPVMGVAMSSGNDGPIDAGVVEPNEQIIPKPDQLTLFQYPVDNRLANPGTTNNLNFGIGIYNGYDATATLSGITIFQIGTAASTEIDSVFLYADVDTNSLFDPVPDARIGALESAGASYAFSNLTLPLLPGKVTTVFAAYSLPLSVTDSATVDLQLFDAQSFVVEPTGLAIQGDFPINSAGVGVVDGMVAAQIGLTTTPGYVAAAGDGNTLALRVKLPRNGLWDDQLRTLEVVNAGSAVAGADLTGFFLWREGGGNPNDFDPLLDIPVGPLVWNGSSWRNSSPFSETVPAGGLDVYVTFGTSPTPTDGATVKAQIPVNGIQMASGNDGPIDKPVTNPAEQHLSTDPLIAVVTTTEDVLSTAQSFDVLMYIRNEGTDTLYSVIPSSITMSGTGSAARFSGPLPAAVDLPPGGDTFFIWTFIAVTAGSVDFCGSAHTADNLIISEAGCSPPVSIKTRAANIPVALSNFAPPSVNRGQTAVRMLSVSVNHSLGDTLTAGVSVEGLRVVVSDANGIPVPPNQLFSSINLSNSSSTFEFSVVDSFTNPLNLVVQQPVTVLPGRTMALDAVFNVSSTADFTPFRVSLQAIGDVELTDPSDGAPISKTSTNAFPWQTTLVDVNSPAQDLLVASGSGPTIAANRGQNNLSVFAIDLLNPGTPSTAAEILTDITFTFADTAGTPIPPAGVIRKIALRSGNQLLFETDQLSSLETDAQFNLSTPLVLTPGVQSTITVLADLSSVPMETGFRLVLVDASALVVRDINDDHFIDVAAANPSTNDFPFGSDLVLFQTAASGLVAQHTNRLPGSMLPGMAAVPVMDVLLQHQDAIGASSVMVDSVALRFVDGGGAPLYPGDYFSALTVMDGANTLCNVTSLSSSTNTVPCKFAAPITLTPSSSRTLGIFAATKSVYSPAIVEIRIEQTGIAVYDVNDGTRLFGIGGTFPFVSGPCTLQLLATQAQVGVESKLPPNVTAGLTDVPAFDLILRNPNGAGVTPVQLRTLHVNVEGRNGPISPASVVAAARLVNRDSTVVTGSITSGNITFAIPDSLLAAYALQSDTASIWIDVAAGAGASFRFALSDTASVDIRDMVSGLRIAATTINGGGFPLRTDYAHILGAGPENAFTNYPNPFAAGRQQTRVTWYLNQPSTVTLKLYTVWGAPVATLLDGAALAPGLHQNVIWDGRNGDGNVVNNGVYYLVLEVDGADGDHSVLRRKVGVVR